MDSEFFELPDTLLCAIGADGDLVWSSRAWEEVLGFDSAALARMPFFDLIHEEDLERFREEFDGLVRAAGRLRTTVRMRTRQGAFRNIDWSLASAVSERRVLGAAREVTVADGALPEGYRDSLTGLPNRALLLDRMAHAVERQKRRPEFKFAILYAGLDRFKVVNDSLGHRIGDLLLAGVARILENTIRPTDTVARIGGDEFAVLLEDIEDVSSTIRVVNRLTGQLKVPFRLDGHELYTDVSIGIAVHDDVLEEPEPLLRDANIAMYRAKQQGGAGYVVFDPRMHEEAVARLELELDLRRAVERGEFETFYQPIVSLSDGGLAGFEALVRWRHPEKGLIPPAAFIPVAEMTGMVVPIGYWVLRDACRQVSAWQEEFPDLAPLTVSVNLSAKQLRDAALADTVAEALEESGLDPECLKLEITESAVIDDTERAMELLYQLKAMSVQLCLDDFGTGYSSLSYLHQLPVDVLKIDRSFVQKVSETERNGNFVATIVQLSHNLNLKVVSEGIETEIQAELLSRMGAEYGQGYYYSRPVTADEARILIAQTSIERRRAQ